MSRRVNLGTNYCVACRVSLKSELLTRKVGTAIYRQTGEPLKNCTLLPATLLKIKRIGFDET